ncbi:MAG: hypothetical protein AAF333_18115 [Planctomycetota bacterium]
MSMFSRQPSLPPERPAKQQRAVPIGVATPQVMAQFAVVGVDTKTGQPISTVIEARSENEAQQIAQQQGIIIDEFKPMHPLAGAAAVKMARSDPDDRFNQHPSYAEHAQGAGMAAAPAPTAGAPAPDPHDIQRPLIDGPAPGTMGAVRQPQTNPLGALAVLGVVGALAFLMYTAVLKDGGARELFALLAAGPNAAEASIDIAEPVGIDLASIQGFEDWQYVNDLDSAPGNAAGPVAGEAEAGPTSTLRLEAIIPPTPSGYGHRGSAVIGGQIVRPGGEVAGYRLVLVRDQHVLLQKGDKLIALRMSKDEG